MKILVVEDDFFQRQLYIMLLKNLELDVTSCSDAQTALESYRRTFYPIILTDRGLSNGMDGLELCRRIRALPQGRHSFILMISGYSTSEDIRMALDSGVDEYLTKPVDERRLLLRLRAYMEALSHHQSEQHDNIRA